MRNGLANEPFTLSGIVGRDSCGDGSVELDEQAASAVAVSTTEKIRARFVADDATSNGCVFGGAVANRNFGWCLPGIHLALGSSSRSVRTVRVMASARRRMGRWFAPGVALSIAVIGSGCGTENSPSSDPAAPRLAGSIRIDGSSTVAPLMKIAAEDFQAENKGVTVTVGTSGTGGGFEKFCNGETDISNASRAIKSGEKEKCAAKGIAFTELMVANDGLTIAVNRSNKWVTCLKVSQLKAMWAPDSKVTNWRDIDPSFPNVKLALFGAGTDSGTFDYFTEVINGKAKASRTDYTTTSR
jgi:PBP superfamily domain